jgi:hypothetical protein
MRATMVEPFNQSLLNTLHDNERLHHRLPKSESKRALVPAPD